MLSALEQKTLQQFKEELQKRFKPKIIDLRLFGSRATGGGDEESDLDILVLLDIFDRAVKSQILDLACDLFLDHGIMISPLVMDQDHFHFLLSRERLLALEIQKEGIPL